MHDDDETKHSSLVLAERSAAIMRHGGDRPPDECEFCCTSCGWRGTLKFDDDERALLDGDVTRYTGPCPGKGSPCDGLNRLMTLVAAESLIGDAMNLQDMTEKRLERQVKVAVDAGMSRIEQKLGEMMGAKKPDEDTKPGIERPDLPDAKDVALDDEDVR